MPLTTLDPRSALVVVDLQNGATLRPAAPHPIQDVIARTVRLADAFRADGRPVVLVRYSVAAGDPDAAPGRTDMSGRGAGSPPAGWDELVPELAGHAEDVVVTKRSWDSFHGTDLDLRLRRRGITQIVLVGVATSIGVESTARTAHEYGYHVTVALDAVTDLDAAAHEHTTRRIFPLIAETGFTEQVLGLLGSAAAAAIAP